MPAIITHDFFGRDVYETAQDLIGTQDEERKAFLLGNQGPDPLFFLVITPLPRYRNSLKIGSLMHRIDPALLLVALKESLDVLEEHEKGVGRAFFAGFLCHYLLDRSMHPFVYSQQYALCDAGIEGLTRKNGSDVHAEIERELDEMVLYEKTGRTVRTFKPYRDILQASDATLRALGKMVEFASMKALRMFPAQDAFGASVKNYRLAMRAFYSPAQRRANAVAFAETRIMRRGGSFFKAMSHRDRAESTSAFDNRDHAPWENPFTHETQTTDFWDIFNAAKAQAHDALRAAMLPTFDVEAAELITGGLNFSGSPAPLRPDDLDPNTNDD